MSDATRIDSLASERTPKDGWSVRAATHDDVEAVAGAVRSLLLELDGRRQPGCTPSGAAAMEDATRALIDSPWEGAVLVAQARVAVVGVLAASWQMAIHVPGPYALIQDLWVDPAWRGQAVGAGLVRALVELARGRRMERVEVGLPRESFSNFAATEAFYLGNGFTPNGPRMRRLIS
ncbi:MAG TPA: GNAT family N-acetyltransferase [Solirubrobacteraceae bacterium]|nr:GNAT family N-acetyltransferase [Solirubrobacteraceae bacterium]